MSTTSTNFALVIPERADAVTVLTHISSNFSTLDSVIGIAHTGTGQLKTGLELTTPSLINPSITGSLTTPIIAASTGNFGVITATGGNISGVNIVFNSISATTGAVTGLTTLQANTVTAVNIVASTGNVALLNVGTYAMPTTLGSPGQVLQVSGTGLVFVANAPGTGASVALNNLTTVAFNTSLNNFTAGVITFTTGLAQSITATAGALSGITALTATSGVITTLNAPALTSTGMVCNGTATMNTITATGGRLVSVTGSFSSVQIGTYTLPSTIGSTGQIMSITLGQPIWIDQTAGASPVYDRLVYAWGYYNTAPDGGFMGTNKGLQFTTQSEYAYGTDGAAVRMIYSAEGTESDNNTRASIPFKFYKTPQVNTVLAYVFAGASTNTGTIKVVIGTSTGTVTVPPAITYSPFAFAINVSPQPDNAWYNGSLYLYKESPSGRIAIQGFQLYATS